MLTTTERAIGLITTKEDQIDEQRLQSRTDNSLLTF